MNITISQQNILKAVRSAERTVSKNVTLPILNTLLLKAEGGTLTVSATNLEVGIRCWAGAKVEQPGSLAVPARIFSEFISSIRDEKLTIVADKQSAVISSEHYKTRILGMKPDEFPIIPTIQKGGEFAIPAKLLHEGIASVIEAASLLETRPELSGILLTSEGKQVAFAATDSFRLAERTGAIASGSAVSCIIPRQAALELMRLSADEGGEIKLIVSENQLSARGSNFELISRLIEGRYPDYRKVIPTKIAASVTADKSELERHVRMASIFSSSISDLTLKADKGAIEIMAKNADRGEIAVQLPGNGLGTFSVTVNYRYLLDGIKSAPSERVVLGYTGEGSPLVLTGEGRTDHVYVIMPLRS